MARAYSQDLRERVVEAGLGGLSARQAAARFGVGVSTAIAWVRRARAGERTARRQGQPKGSKLAPHADYLLGLIAGTPHISLRELQARLADEKGVSAGVGTLWRFFAARAITFKKNRARGRAGQGPTSAPRVRRGSRGNSISTRPGWCSSMRPASRPRWPVCADAAPGASACAQGFPMAIGEQRPSWRACACTASARPWSWTGR